MQLVPLTAALIAFFLVQIVQAHVLLTFPPARYPQYDYLDNYRTGGPCGVAGKYIVYEITYIVILLVLLPPSLSSFRRGHP